MEKKIISGSLASFNNNNAAKPQISNIKSTRIGVGASCSCSTITGPTGVTGATGPTGLSAYDVAVESHCFTGTEAEWLESLVGVTGPQIILGGIIPYASDEFMISFEEFSSNTYYEMMFLNFFDEPLTRSFEVFPTTFSYAEEGRYVESFTTSKPTLLTGMAFEISGEVGLIDEGTFVAKVFAYYGPSRDTNYYFIPESVTTLSPILTDGRIIASGISNFEFEVPAKSKIVVAIAIEQTDPIVDESTCTFTGLLWGSLFIEEVTGQS